MANKKFTEEKMNHLRANSYSLDVSPSIVHFRAKFKKLFWNLIQEGKEPYDIASELGIDPNILGEYHVNALKGMIRNEVQAGKGLREGATVLYVYYHRRLYKRVARLGTEGIYRNRFFLETVKQLIENYGISLASKTLINSDQVRHYTSTKFIRWNAKTQIVLGMG